MIQMLSAFLSALVAAVLVLFVIGVATGYLFNRHIRTHHPSAWRDLGEPSFWNRSIKSDIRWLRYVWKSGYRSLGDKTLNRIGGRLKALQIGYFVSWLLLVLLFIWIDSR